MPATWCAHAQLAFSVGFIEQCKQLLVAVFDRDYVRATRLAFESQSYLTATLRQAVDRFDHVAPRKVPLAERTAKL